MGDEVEASSVVAIRSSTEGIGVPHKIVMSEYGS